MDIRVAGLTASPSPVGLTASPSPVGLTIGTALNSGNAGEEITVFLTNHEWTSEGVLTGEARGIIQTLIVSSLTDCNLINYVEGGSLPSPPAHNIPELLADYLHNNFCNGEHDYSCSWFREEAWDGEEHYHWLNKAKELRKSLDGWTRKFE